LSWLQSSSKSLRSAASASGAAAASVADASGFSPGGRFCAPAGSTDAMLTAASISSTARPYRVVEAITPPAFLMTDDACTSARNCGGAKRGMHRHCEEQSDEAIPSLTTKVNGMLGFARNDDARTPRDLCRMEGRAGRRARQPE